MTTSPFRGSLYGRAVFFIALGAACLLGAVIAFSSLVLRDSRERLLDERVQLARMAGRLVEARVRADIQRFARRATLVLDAGGPELASELNAVLRDEAAESLFTGGTCILEPNGSLLYDGGSCGKWLDENAVRRLKQELDTGKREVSASRLLATGSERAILVMATMRTTGPLGYAAGILPMGETGLLEESLLGTDGLEVDLVDRNGTVMVSTQPGEVDRTGGHQDLLARAVDTGEDVRGVCHTCHEGGDGSVARKTHVMAFSPLPSLPLGMAVFQENAKALGPAFSLRSRLLVLGAVLISLFMASAVLSVKSVVRPIKRLTAAVSGRSKDDTQISPNQFGSDEIGELAGALAHWRGRMKTSLHETEQHREALRRERDVVQRHLDALQEISDLSIAHAELTALVSASVSRWISMGKLRYCALMIERGETRIWACDGIDQAAAERLLRAGDAHDEVVAAARGDLGAGFVSFAVLNSETQTLVVADTLDETVDESIDHSMADTLEETLKEAAVRELTPHTALFESGGGLRIRAIWCDTEDGPRFDPRWGASLIRHLGMCASHLFLRDADRAQRAQYETFLRRLLRGQEEERSRVARDLHDTLAQELAALRLDMERLAAKAALPEMRTELERTELRAGEMLDTVRRILLGLRPPPLETMGFVPAMRWLSETTSTASGLRVQLLVDGDEARELPYEVAMNLFRIYQECLLNVTRHARAEHVFATINLGDDEISLTVEDDGCGFDPKDVEPAAQKGGRGLGLLGIKERAHLLGGDLAVTSEPGEGTCMEVTVPGGVGGVNQCEPSA